MTRTGNPHSRLTVLLDAFEAELLAAPADEVRDALREAGRAGNVACQEVRALLNEAIAASEDGSAATAWFDTCAGTGLDRLFGISRELRAGARCHPHTGANSCTELPSALKGEDRPCKPEKTASVGRTARLDGRRVNDGFRRVSPIAPNPGEGLLTEPIPAIRSWSRERVFMLRVFGRLPVTDSAARFEGRRPKSLRGGNRGGVCAGSGVGLWGFRVDVSPDP